MSAKITTVGDLIKVLSQYREDLPVVIVNPVSDDWKDEGTVDGVRVSEIFGWEVRTGWHVLHESEVDKSWLDSGGANALLLLNDWDGKSLLEHQDEIFGGPSPFAEGDRET